MARRDVRVRTDAMGMYETVSRLPEKYRIRFLHRMREGLRARGVDAEEQVSLAEAYIEYMSADRTIQRIPPLDRPNVAPPPEDIATSELIHLLRRATYSMQRHLVDARLSAMPACVASWETDEIGGAA